ncbi:MAG: GGDEF domain-containing protein [Gammaproteobacteria bacterium]|nr:GGDEF domain-containing protein [Gammaproteobacteria bacterium]
MRVKITSQFQLFVVCVGVTGFAVLVTEMSLVAILMFFGPAAFNVPNLFYLGAAIPAIIAAPTTYVMARTGLELSHAHTNLRRLANTDELTGLINRRSFFASANQILAEAETAGGSIALLVIDADYFKQLNDTYGHATGDAALQFIAERISSCVRKDDFTCRLGGEEFAILLPGMTEETACPLAKRILERISTQPMLFDNKIIEMSVSCGVADTTISYDMNALFKAADDALYAAKDAGRNRIIPHADVPPGDPHSSPAMSTPS